MQTDNIIEEIRDRLELTQQGKPANTAMNYKMVFQNDPLLKGAIRKNLLTERIDIVKPLGWYRESTTLTDVDIKYLLLYLEENYGLTVEKKIEDAVAVIANENRYHPICDFLNGLECLFSMDKTKKMQMAQYQIFVSRLWSEISRKTGYLNLVNYNNSGNNEEIFDELQKKGLLEEKIFV